MFIAFVGAFQSEIKRLIRSPLLITLTIIQALTFIFLVNFFGLTGAFAPTAIIDQDKTYYSKLFIEKLKLAHHSFTLKPMTEIHANDLVKKGKLVAIITIPKGFSEKIESGETVPLKVIVDNIDTDMTADIQRALPSALSLFAKDLNLPGVRVQTKELDLIDHDTGFVPYLVVSALGLSALIISSILGSITVAREFETGQILILKSSPAPILASILGRLSASNLISLLTMLIALLVIIFGYGISPLYPIELILIITISIVVFGIIGALVGAIIKHSMPVATIIFGFSLPLYLFSGTYEPERFDGNIIWILAHFTPLYYVVGILEHAFLGLHVTPESVLVNFICIILFGLFSLIFLRNIIKKSNTS